MSTNIAFGCSHTSGVGNLPEQSWPTLLGLVNYGSTGVSVDYIARICEPHIVEHKPRYVYILWPDWTRFEYERHGKINQSLPTDSNRIEFIERDETWLRKNWLISVCKVENICKKHNVTLVDLTLDNLANIIDHSDCWPPASDNSHYDYRWHQWVADLFKVRKSFKEYDQT